MDQNPIAQPAGRGEHDRSAGRDTGVQQVEQDRAAAAERQRRAREKAREKARRLAAQGGLPPDARKSSDIRPKHVLGEAGSEVWYHSQQYAFERHMERLGIPKTGTRSSDSHSAAGERPLVGLGGRF